jgi:hypothetical protein
MEWVVVVIDDTKFTTLSMKIRQMVDMLKWGYHDDVISTSPKNGVGKPFKP